MRVDILTIFPEMFHSLLDHSILARAIKSGSLEVALHNIRDYSQNKHKNTDDYTFGGGAGMLMLAQPILSCLAAVAGGAPCRKIYLSPRGRVLTQAIAGELAQEPRLVLLCGHYEGVDERAVTAFDEELSIGDYVLTGGELPAMVLVDCVARLLPGVLGSEESAQEDSFGGGLLEYPQYTRPAVLDNGSAVPEVLLNGNHAHIRAWRRQKSLETTLRNRPDLLETAPLTPEDREYLARLRGENGLPE